MQATLINRTERKMTLFLKESRLPPLASPPFNPRDRRTNVDPRYDTSGGRAGCSDDSGELSLCTFKPISFSSPRKPLIALGIRLAWLCAGPFHNDEAPRSFSRRSEPCAAWQRRAITILSVQDPAKRTGSYCPEHRRSYGPISGPTVVSG